MRREASGERPGYARGWIVVTLVAVLVGVIVFQRWQMTHHPLLTLRVGEHLPAVDLASLAGAPVRIDWNSAQSGSLVYVFSPDCAWCGRNLASVRALARAHAGRRFIGLSLSRESLEAYVTEHALDFPVYASPGPGVITALKLSATPETILVSNRGIVERVWLGAYTGKIRTEINNAFGVDLPALSEGSLDERHY